jgi:hypothetical protein
MLGLSDTLGLSCASTERSVNKSNVLLFMIYLILLSVAKLHNVE